MSGLIFGENKSFAMLLKNLMESVKECQNVYGKNKTLLATEKDIRFDDQLKYKKNSNEKKMITFHFHWLIGSSGYVRIGKQLCRMVSKQHQYSKILFLAI